ncbi:MAG: beta-hydroxyacyl-ACP dehydratase [Rhodobiaceae bacterium]|nr:beta-hydroxyacyl-ACP dehydratase [Rhodobiaceae bacterium]MCC0057210.1 beta-hydroxyacyl-ACP dehydratase [Rhodobiaceae bacterium]
MQLEYFQMIDRVVEMDLDRRTIRIEAIVPEKSTVFEGHFPGHPLLPGTLMIEAMAQSLGFLTLNVLEWARVPLLTGVTKAKIRRFIEPETTLLIDATLLQDGQGYAVGEAEISHNGKRVANASLSYVVTPFPSEVMKSALLEVKERILNA